jgi:hypothetical protein
MHPAAAVEGEKKEGKNGADTPAFMMQKRQYFEAQLRLNSLGLRPRESWACGPGEAGPAAQGKVPSDDGELI